MPMIVRQTHYSNVLKRQIALLLNPQGISLVTTSPPWPFLHPSERLVPEKRARNWCEEISILNSGKIYLKLTKIAGSNNAQIKIPLILLRVRFMARFQIWILLDRKHYTLAPWRSPQARQPWRVSRSVTFSISRWGTLILSVLSGNEMGIKANVKGQICSSGRRKKCPLVKEDLSKKRRGVWRPETLSTNTRWDLTILTISHISWQLKKNIHNQLNSN